MVLGAGVLPSLSGVLGVARAWKLYRNPVKFDDVFRALVWSRVGALQNSVNFDKEPTLESLWCIRIPVYRDTHNITSERVICQS
jgi:hypothetical protein